MLEVLEGGIQTTVQDFPGRVGYLDLGTYPAGPMDHFAFRTANLLVGNTIGAPSPSPARTRRRPSTARPCRSGRASPSRPATCSR